MKRSLNNLNGLLSKWQGSFANKIKGKISGLGDLYAKSQKFSNFFQEKKEMADEMKKKSDSFLKERQKESEEFKSFISKQKNLHAEREEKLTYISGSSRLKDESEIESELLKEEELANKLYEEKMKKEEK